MAKRIFTLIAVVSIGVFLGVSIVAKQAREPLLKALFDQQTEILTTQKRIEKRLVEVEEGDEEEFIEADDTFLSDTSDLEDILENQRNLEKRISSLESRIKNMQADFKQLQLVKQADRAPAAPPSEDFSKVYEIDIVQSYVKGNQDALVSVVEFVDFQCPYCAKFHPPLVEAVNAFSAEQVNFMVKNFPLSFHPQARPAAKAALAAGEQGQYFKMVDLLLETGKNLNEDTFKKLAEQLGLDVEKFLKDYKEKDQQWENYIQADMALGSRVEVRGTPTFFIGGRKTHARDAESIKKEIEEALNKK